MEWKWNGKGMEMIWEWDRIGLKMEQKWNANGMKRDFFSKQLFIPVKLKFP